jgi:anaerobic magnesium-protoporphyrin IX monomethyl ester cyclase
MRVALVNPAWSFDGSIYFGCREPHLPLEYGYARHMLEAAGHQAVIVDGQLGGMTSDAIRQHVARLRPDMTVVTTAPSYLFWRCAPPELRVPQQTIRDLREIGGLMVAIGPHGSTTPRATLAKLGADVVVIGESEEILVMLAASGREDWQRIPSIAYRRDGAFRIQGGPYASDLAKLPALIWPQAYVARHTHHHHRFDPGRKGIGAEMETSRGCPYACSFCAKENFRDKYRRRPLPVILEELDGLIAQGVEYVYFIDEIFLPNRALLEALADRDIRFGVQTRIDLWKPDMLELLGRAGCVSIEAELDDEAEIARWRAHLQAHGVWANEPVPLFPYPGSPDYRKLWGFPDDQAWERAHAHYLRKFDAFSDIQEQRPRSLRELESSAAE